MYSPLETKRKYFYYRERLGFYVVWDGHIGRVVTANIENALSKPYLGDETYILIKFFISSVDPVSCYLERRIISSNFSPIMSKSIFETFHTLHAF
jgi:hypothetical protein